MDSRPRWRWTKTGMELDLANGEFCFVRDIPRLAFAQAAPLVAETLARALHDQKKGTGGFIGCGWDFASEVGGEALCPCPQEARDLLARLSSNR